MYEGIPLSNLVCAFTREIITPVVYSQLHMLYSVLPKWDPSMSIPFHMITVWAYKTHLTVVFQKCGSCADHQNLESAGVNMYIYIYIYTVCTVLLLTTHANIFHGFLLTCGTL